MNQMAQVLFSPVEAFTKSREKGGWLLPFFAVIVLTVVVVWLQMPLTKKTLELSLQGKPLPAGMTMEQIINLNTIIGTCIAVLLPVFVVFAGGLLLMIVNLFIRGQANYIQLSKVALFSYIPWMLSGLISGILIRVLDPSSPYEVMLNAGALLSEKKGILYHLLAMADPFRIWMLVLVIIGTSVVSGKSKSSVWPWIVSLWVVFSLLSIFFTNQTVAG